MLEFALRWMPHGGAPDDELFVLFGMTRSRFAEALQSQLADSHYEQATAHRVLRSYRAPGHCP